jgi:SnoaL-like domain
MSDEAPHGRTPQIVSRYFEADASRDVEAILALFTDDATVTDEGGTWRGKPEIRDWRLGPVSKYEYTTTVARIDRLDDNHYRASGHIDGNFPGATAHLKWDFMLVEGLIGRLRDCSLNGLTRCGPRSPMLTVVMKDSAYRDPDRKPLGAPPSPQSLCPTRLATASETAGRRFEAVRGHGRFRLERAELGSDQLRWKPPKPGLASTEPLATT